MLSVAPGFSVSGGRSSIISLVRRRQGRRGQASVFQVMDMILSPKPMMSEVLP